MRYERVKMLFGEDFEKLTSAKILLLGTGGVGSFCLDCLYRTGITDVTIVDFDRYEISNQNRQIGSEHVGEIKVEVLKRLYPTVTPLKAKIDKEWIESFDFDPYHVVLDAIDDLKAKVALAHKCSHKLISSTGSARKCDPTKMAYDSIWKSFGDPFAKKFRYELKKSGFDKDFPVIFSPEEPRTPKKGSFVAVTGSFGLALCSKAVEFILKK